MKKIFAITLLTLSAFAAEDKKPAKPVEAAPVITAEEARDLWFLQSNALSIKQSLEAVTAEQKKMQEKLTTKCGDKYNLASNGPELKCVAKTEATK